MLAGIMVSSSAVLLMALMGLRQTPAAGRTILAKTPQQTLDHQLMAEFGNPEVISVPINLSLKNPRFHSPASQLTESLEGGTQLRSEGFPALETWDAEETTNFSYVIQYAKEQRLDELSMPEIVQSVAEHFLGIPYTSGLLDQSLEETLKVSLQKFDCVLFVEVVLAVSRGVAVKDYSEQMFLQRVENLRYVNGNLNGYCSRLHYFSDWIADNEKRAMVTNITANLGGIPFQKTLNFMSQHRELYPQIAKNEANYQCILEREKRLSELALTYLPYSQIRNIYSQLKPGDIVAVATEIDGLDVTHTGFVYRNADGNVGLIHASPAGEVTIAYDLQRYVSRVEQAIGIIVARPVDPRQP